MISSKNQGYSLLEASIALMILSIGILNIAALQTTTTISNHSAYLYSIATQQVVSMLELSYSELSPKDLIMWQQNVASYLPQGQGEYDQHKKMITVCWFDRFTHTNKCLKGLE